MQVAACYFSLSGFYALVLYWVFRRAGAREGPFGPPHGGPLGPIPSLATLASGPPGRDTAIVRFAPVLLLPCGQHSCTNLEGIFSQ